MKEILKWLERFHDKYRQPPLREITCHGNWRVIYPNGEKTYWMDYLSAANMVACFGGQVIHRNQQGQDQ